MITNCKNILVLAPHTDDGELGLGGTISRLIEDGKKSDLCGFLHRTAIGSRGFSERYLEDRGQASDPDLRYRTGKPNHIQLRSKKTGIRKTRDIRGVNTPEKSIRF